MLQNFLLGGGLAFAAAAQPGPLQAFLIARVTGTGWRRTLPACLAPVISDAPIAALVLLVLGQIPPAAQHALRAAGGLLLLYLAWGALRQWREPAASGPPPSAPRTLLEAVMVNVLNPNPYLGWALVLGPTAVTAWREAPSHAVVFVGSFYGLMVLMLALFVLLLGTVSLLGPRGRRALLGLSAMALAGLGLFLLLIEIWRFHAA